MIVHQYHTLNLTHFKSNGRITSFYLKPVITRYAIIRKCSTSVVSLINTERMIIKTECAWNCDDEKDK